MATKVNPWNNKTLSEQSVFKQFNTSLASMKVDKVDILYLHAPDHETPLLETLKAVNDLHKAGKFNELGLSNYSSWLVAEVVNLCKQNNFVVPTVYQVLRSNKASFIHFSRACTRQLPVRSSTNLFPVFDITDSDSMPTPHLEVES